jgi:hypothetical protein
MQMIGEEKESAYPQLNFPCLSSIGQVRRESLVTL